MPFSAKRFSEKLVGLRESHGYSAERLSQSSGISPVRLTILESGIESPTGDEILILAAIFMCEFRWLIEDDEPNPDENLELLLRFEGEKLTSDDRQAISEFLYLCK